MKEPLTVQQIDVVKPDGTSVLVTSFGRYKPTGLIPLETVLELVHRLTGKKSRSITYDPITFEPTDLIGSSRIRKYVTPETFQDLVGRQHGLKSTVTIKIKSH